MKRAATALAAFCICVLACAPSRAQSVVVNKYQNSGTTADIVELLVIQDSLDMRGMILKDFSSNMANDGGGKYQFTTDPLWASVPAGTLIVLRNNNSAADTAVGGGDLNLDIGLQNTTYFTNAGGTFDIATTEMVMIKDAGTGAAGGAGNIHTLAGGTAGTQFTSTATPKLRATGTSAAGPFVFANNSTQTLADFNGTDATRGATGLTFGAGHNANNTAYINSLRVTGPAPEPTVQASNVVFSSVGATSMNVSWTNGNGVSRIVLAKQGSPVDAAPSDGTAYTPNAAFGSGSELSPMTATPSSLALRPGRTMVVATAPTGRAMLLAGSRATVAAAQPTRATTTTVATQPTNGTASGAMPPAGGTAWAGGGNFVVFAGSGNSVTVTNLQPSTTYFFAVFEFNGAGTSTNYLTTNPATGTQATAAAFQISGTVRNRGGNGISGVALTLASGDTALANAVTDGGGNYAFANVTAARAYAATPPTTSVTVSPPPPPFPSLPAHQNPPLTAPPPPLLTPGPPP